MMSEPWAGTRILHAYPRLPPSKSRALLTLGYLTLPQVLYNIDPHVMLVQQSSAWVSMSESLHATVALEDGT
jgi:hypothetical protein